jgi:hypothetical protein
MVGSTLMAVGRNGKAKIAEPAPQNKKPLAVKG